jgi:catechol-2,3-dioxygenase
VLSAPGLRACARTGPRIPDLSVSRPWYRALIGTDPIVDTADPNGFQHVVFMLGNGTVFGIHQHDRPAPDGERFSELRTGLDHVAFGCANRTELEQWAGRLDELGIEHSGIVDVDYGSVLNFRDPDGIALEFFAFPG